MKNSTLNVLCVLLTFSLSCAKIEEGNNPLFKPDCDLICLDEKVKHLNVRVLINGKMFSSQNTPKYNPYQDTIRFEAFTGPGLDLLGVNYQWKNEMDWVWSLWSFAGPPKEEVDRAIWLWKKEPSTSSEQAEKGKYEPALSEEDWCRSKTYWKVGVVAKHESTSLKPQDNSDTIEGRIRWIDAIADAETDTFDQDVYTVYHPIDSPRGVFEVQCHE